MQNLFNVSKKILSFSVHIVHVMHIAKNYLKRRNTFLHFIKNAPNNDIVF